MALDAGALSEIELVLAGSAEPAQAAASLRQRFPALTVTRCDPSDVDMETPFLVTPRVTLFLVDGADHCWRLTADPARATGVVVVAS
jgi:hypothetical protein